MSAVTGELMVPCHNALLCHLGCRSPSWHAAASHNRSGTDRGERASLGQAYRRGDAVVGGCCPGSGVRRGTLLQLRKLQAPCTTRAERVLCDRLHATLSGVPMLIMRDVMRRNHSQHSHSFTRIRDCSTACCRSARLGTKAGGVHPRHGDGHDTARLGSCFAAAFH